LLLAVVAVEEGVAVEVEQVVIEPLRELQVEALPQKQN
jgi:hypothetical protein